MNSICLIGRLTKDPNFRFTKNNKLVASFTLAVNRSYKTDDNITADFIPIVAYGKSAEFVKNYFTKGQQVGLTGRLNTRNWEDKENKKHYVTEVVANRFYFADVKKNLIAQNKSDSNIDDDKINFKDVELPF